MFRRWLRKLGAGTGRCAFAFSWRYCTRCIMRKCKHSYSTTYIHINIKGKCMRARQHSIQIYDDNTESLLFVDAENAFNVLNRKAVLHHISVLCPVMSIILKNTYGGTFDLYVSGEILIRWRNHAGRPLVISMHAVGKMPLIHELQPTGTKQV